MRIRFLFLNIFLPLLVIFLCTFGAGARDVHSLELYPTHYSRDFNESKEDNAKIDILQRIHLTPYSDTYKIHLANDGSYFVTVGYYGDITIFSQNNLGLWGGKLLHNMSDWGTQVAIAPDSSFFVSVGMQADPPILFWSKDFEGSWNSTPLKNPHDHRITKLVFSKDGSYFLTASREGIYVWTKDDTGKWIPGNLLFFSGLQRIVLTDNPRVFLSAYEGIDSIVSWIKNSNGKWERSYLPIQKGRIFSIANSGDYLVEGRKDGKISIWEKNHEGKWELASTLNAHRRSIGFIQIAPDSSFFITAGYTSLDYEEVDTSILVWMKNEFGDWVPSLPLKGHSDQAYVIAIAPDGSYFVSAGDFHDKNLVVWKRLSGNKWENFAQLRQHTNLLCSENIVFSKDQNFILSGDRDHEIISWRPVMN